MPKEAVGPAIGGGLGLIGSLFSSGSQSEAANQQAQALQQNAEAQRILNDMIVKILNSQLALYQQSYEPLERQAAGTAFQQGKLPFPEIAAGTIQDLLSPYQLPPAIRQVMLEQLASAEKRKAADLIRQLTSQGIGGGQLAAALSNLAEASLPARYGIERDIALETASREEQRKMQAFNIAQGILAQNQQFGQAGRAIPGYASGTLGNLAGQYAQAATAASQNRIPPQQNLFSGLGTTLAKIFNTTPTKEPDYFSYPPLPTPGFDYNTVDINYPSPSGNPYNYMGGLA